MNTVNNETVMNTEVNTTFENTETKTVSENKIKRDYVPHRRVSMRICKECGKMYILSDKDATYFLENFHTLPLRCEDCRKKSHKPVSDVESKE